MKITLSMIYEKLKTHYRCTKNKSDFSDNPLHSLLLYFQGSLSPKCVYVADSAELRGEELAGFTVICAGEPNFDYRSIPFDLVIVEDEVDLKELFNRVQTIFLSLLNWDAQLKYVSRDSMDLEQLLEESRKELHYSFIFLNKFFKPIAISSDLSSDGTLDEKQSRFLESVLQDAAVEDVGRYVEARYFQDLAHNKKGLFFNIYYNTDYRGKLLAICDSDKEITRADKCLFENVCRHVEKMYELFSISSMRAPGYVLMQRVLRAVLSDSDQYSKAQAMEALQYAGWGVNDRYVVYFIPFDEKGTIPVRAEYIVTLLENRWSSATGGSTRGIVLKDGIACIINTSQPVEVNIDAFMPGFIDLVHSFSAQVGMSAPCYDFFSLHIYLKQAAIAIQLGSRLEPDAAFYGFSKYSLDHMLDSAVGPFNPEDVVHPSLLTLMKYDRENNTEYCKTLRVFIKCNFNVLQASSELYIHRSTFSVRIKRIESICQIDLDNERTRLHILISFYIMENLGLIRQHSEGQG